MEADMMDELYSMVFPGNLNFYTGYIFFKIAVLQITMLQKNLQVCWALSLCDHG